MFQIWVTDDRVKGPPKRYLHATAVDKDHLDHLLSELHYDLFHSGGDEWGTPHSQSAMWKVEVIPKP